MKKIFAAVLFVTLLFGVIWVRNTHTLHTQNMSTAEKNVSPSKTQQTASNTSIFVPYWTVSSNKELASYDELYYFGVAASTTGIDTSDTGYKRIGQFLSKTSDGQKKFLVVRMVDKDLNSKIVKDALLQQKIASQAVQLAHDNGFDGIVLDFETASISFTSTTNRITSLYSRFANSIKKADLKFYVTLYGDTYYRVRAYDVKKISGLADKVLVMTYDFHKASGSPGPDFPLAGKETYGYDLSKMADNFLADVPASKLSIIYGMFGYDWQVDKDGKTIDTAESGSLEEMYESFITACSYQNCTWQRDSTSSEIKVTYVDDDGNKHEVWFEDIESVKRKSAYFDMRGIHNSGYWAYGYF